MSAVDAILPRAARHGLARRLNGLFGLFTVVVLAILSAARKLYGRLDDREAASRPT
ncbi:hypothetical protein [Micromonospora sp. WMMD737]|uniref:hypothetical protein n=1 Tax=Micromonospora sp. WMMD737 TaxID=3404113 RepID=UPI003B9448B9